MKKALLTVALCFGALAASAQVSVVKEAKSKKSNPEEAAKIIEAALTNPETAKDPKTWQLAGEFQQAIYDAENMKMYLPAGQGGGSADTTKLYNSLAKLFEYYLKCDQVEQEAVKSGALKKAKLRKKLAPALKKVRMNLLNGGSDAYNKQDYAKATKFFGMYVDVAGEPMFADDPSIAQDTLKALYASYAALSASLNKDNANVLKYGVIGKDDKTEGYRSLMCMAEVYKAKETADSVKWLALLTEGVEKFPQQDYFVGNLMDYYLTKGMIKEGLAQMDKLLQKEEKVYFRFVKGVLLYENKQYDDAIVELDKVIAKGGDLAAEAYAKKGDCYFWPAQKIVEENANLQFDDPKLKTNEDKIKELYEKAKPLYEKARELEPDNKQIWGQYLLNIYWKLNKAEYEVLEKELGYK